MASVDALNNIRLWTLLISQRGSILHAAATYLLEQSGNGSMTLQTALATSPAQCNIIHIAVDTK